MKYFHLLVTRAFGVVVTHRVRCFVMRRAAVRFPARPIPFTKIPTPLASPCHPPASTISCHRPTLPFHMARPKPSYERSVSGFWPKPHPRPRIGERAAPPAPPCHSPAPTTSHHRPTSPFYGARPKPSYECSVSRFWPKPCPLPSHWQTCSPPAVSMPSTCTNNLPSSPHTIVSHGTPETESPLSVFGCFDPHSSLSHTRSLTTTTTLSTAPQHLSPLPSMAICTDTEPLHSVFGFL